MSVDVLTLHYDIKIADTMFNSKLNELKEVANKYEISLYNLKEILHSELLESNMKVGACNTAIDFLIVETIDNSKLYNSIRDGIKECILASAIYYVNGINKSEYV